MNKLIKVTYLKDELNDLHINAETPSESFLDISDMELVLLLKKIEPERNNVS